ncbi:ubiquinol-cytochrome c reductase iron-sulfur subunit [Sediminibacillus massiliensis]|uniref:QcrA and Rieske domain-containing protein n=1 Tax=Sediminibacillus massiliensis TaxID=1926277 RepID=UPI000988666C|nr:ubiquinol-cytochrome c reductase iron-sulfur subunit [Sediminibacillus massiliensis]
MSEKKQQVSRRQFLNYTLTGVGGFMAAGMLAPMVRFAIDPVLTAQTSGDFKSVANVDDITEEPQRVDWEIDQVDAWYESTVTKTAWVYKDENGDIVALSPICKHLGCMVTWAGSEEYPDEFFCPCHEGRYYKSGENVPGTPPSEGLDYYEYKIENGSLLLGPTKPRGEA